MKYTVLLLLLFCVSAHTQDVAPLASGPGEASNGEEVSLEATCGISSVEFVLSALNLSYSLAQVREQLLGDGTGSSIASLVRVLQSHCVRVEARKGMTGKGLRKHLRAASENLAVACIGSRSGVVGHAIVLAAVPDGVAFYDEARGLEVEPWEAFFSWCDESDSAKIMLLVQPASTAEPGLREELVFEPPEMDFGVLSKGTTVRERVLLHNKSEFPIAIVKASRPCVCTDVSVPERVIPSRGSVSVEVEVKEALWGRASKRKDIYLVFADGSHTVLPVLATQDTGNRLDPHPASLFLSHLEYAVPGSSEPRLIHIRNLTLDESQGGFVLSTDVSWLRLEQELRHGPGKHPYWANELVVRVFDELTNDLFHDANRLSGEIVIRSEVSNRLGEVSVKAMREPLFCSEPGFLTVESLPQSGRLRITRRAKGGMFRVLSAKSHCVAVEANEGWVKDVAELSVRPGAEADKSSGPGQIDLVLEYQNSGKRFSLTIPVVAL